MVLYVEIPPHGLLQKHKAGKLVEGLKWTCAQLQTSQAHLKRTSAHLDHAVRRVVRYMIWQLFTSAFQKHRILRQADIISQRVAAEKELRAEFVSAVHHVVVSMIVTRWFME